MGLDDPLIVRYARWMGLIPDMGGTLNGLLQGQFGDSTLYKRPVIEVIKAPIGQYDPAKPVQHHSYPCHYHSFGYLLRCSSPEGFR